MLLILYGIENNYKDVTKVSLSRMDKNNIINIPKGDHARAKIFGDPIPGQLKHIKVIDDFNFLRIYKDEEFIKLKIINNLLSIKCTYDKSDLSLKKLGEIHKTLKINFGNLQNELPEQTLAVRYIQPGDKVLELGGNIGRVSCVIARIIKNQKNLLVLESSPKIAQQLKHNREINQLKFQIEPSALSYRPLKQSGWVTTPLYSMNNTSNLVSTITWEKLNTKYKINFNVLVCDCEGALYYILKDNPNIISDIETIILENDFPEIYMKNFVDEVLINKGFFLAHNQELTFPPMVCKDSFYQVWKKNK